MFLIKLATSQKGTVLLSSEDSKSLRDDDLQFMSDGVINLVYINDERGISVSKFRGSDYKHGFHSMKIKDNGMVVYPRLDPREVKRAIITETISSGIQLLRDEFYDSVRETISVTQVDPEQLVFEITESEMLISFTEINEKLKEIREIGISVSIDDFGTGYSSFSRLRDLNVDEVKIDKSFIDRISSIDEKELLTPDIISMAHKMKLAVVAEGVEDDVQKEYLMRHDCDILQGYLYSRPLNEHDSLNFLIAER